MTIERMITAMAGSFIMASLLLAYYASHYWLLLTAFVGFNLFQSSFTGFCPATMIFEKLGFKSCAEMA
jgi:uncharacterized phage infection (PIP) family protein YhgE